MDTWRALEPITRTSSLSARNVASPGGLRVFNGFATDRALKWSGLGLGGVVHVARFGRMEKPAATPLGGAGARMIARETKVQIYLCQTRTSSLCPFSTGGDATPSGSIP
jgi:hypothetical protein